MSDLSTEALERLRDQAREVLADHGAREGFEAKQTGPVLVNPVAVVDAMLAFADRLRTPPDGELPGKGYTVVARPTSDGPQAREVVERLRAYGVDPREYRGAKTCIEAADLIETLLTRLSASPVPEGFALVPIEPTEAMLQAGFGPFMGAHDPMFSANEPTAPIYRAMLAAAPPVGLSSGETGK